MRVPMKAQGYVPLVDQGYGPTSSTQFGKGRLRAALDGALDHPMPTGLAPARCELAWAHFLSGRNNAGVIGLHKKDILALSSGNGAFSSPLSFSGEDIRERVADETGNSRLGRHGRPPARCVAVLRCCVHLNTASIDCIFDGCIIDGTNRPCVQYWSCFEQRYTALLNPEPYDPGRCCRPAADCSPSGRKHPHLSTSQNTKHSI